ncbi:MAG: hypothetical protein HYT37_02360 [Candidatus Sungbacteria bacterium]|nr:hypothetical protein [Candidatus Sungbacteria bacterium]
MVKKQVTTEDLAVMIKNAFESVDKRFDAVDRRLINLEHDVLYLKSHATKMEVWISKHEDEHDAITLRLTKLEKIKAKA